MLVLKGQGASGTGKNAFLTSEALGFGNRLVAKCGNYPAETAVGKTEGPYAQTLPTYRDAPATEHALIGVVNKFRTAGINRQIQQQFPESLRLELDPQVAGYCLKLTNAVAGAVGAVHRVAGHEQLEAGSS